MANTSPRKTEERMAGVVQFIDDEREHRRQLSLAVNRLRDGKVASVGSFTLTASVANTTLSDERIGLNSVVILVPTTANASAEIGAGTIFQTYPQSAKKAAVFTHANNGQTDRTFAFVILG